MFKWGKRDSKASGYEPKTPKLSSVALPAGRYTPITTLKSPPTHKPISNLLFRHFTPDRRNITSGLERRPTPIDTSRARTLSSPPAHLPAPRPIRPHPSQGPFFPTDDREFIMNPARAPVSVPSAQYLEEQIRRQPPDPLRPGQAMTQKLLDAEYDYPEEKRLKDVVSKNQEAEINRVPSKAYKDLLEEDHQSTSAMKGSSRRNPVGFNDWKPVPVLTDLPVQENAPNDRRPVLKSAMKRTSSTAAPPKSAMKKSSSTAAPLKSAMKKAPEPVGKGWYSEGESSGSKTAERSSKIRITQMPSKAFLEQEEEIREEKRLQSLGIRSREPRGLPVYGSNAFPPTNSATPSPVEPVHVPQEQDRHRTRRASHGSDYGRSPYDSRYLPVYIRPATMEEHLLQICDDWDKGISHSPLAWPLVDFSTRRREPMPLVWFDAGFNPRLKKYAVKAKRGPIFTPLTREEETMLLCSIHTIHHITIVNRRLDRWPIHIHLPYQIRVIDVFRAIYDIYCQPLTVQEMEAIGAETISRCRRAWSQRCEDGPDFLHNEERKGFLRIDLLRGRRIFKGMVPVPGMSDTYELLFDEGR